MHKPSPKGATAGFERGRSGGALGPAIVAKPAPMMVGQVGATWWVLHYANIRNWPADDADNRNGPWIGRRVRAQADTEG